MPDPVLRFEYPGSETDDGRGDPGRKHFYLCKTDRVVSEVQVFDKGVRNRLHSHPVEDGVWVVLKGKATFYGDGDAVLGELGPFQGMLIPAGTKYWFEGSSDEPLEILRVDYHVPEGAGNTNGPSPTEAVNSYGAKRWSAFGE